MTAPLLALTEVDAAPAPDAPAVLSHVDLTLHAGECLALVGPSGAGKTTLLRTIAGQLTPRSGSVRFGGENLGDLLRRDPRGTRARIGLISQHQDLVDTLRAETNVMVGALGRWGTGRALRHLIRPSRDERAEALAALEAVGLGDKLRRRTAQLSGGEQQRVAIARALVQAPELLLADEPVAALDRDTARRVMALLTRLARERGVGLICSLHQLELAATHCDRVLEVRDGAVTERAA